MVQCVVVVAWVVWGAAEDFCVKKDRYFFNEAENEEQPTAIHHWLQWAIHHC